jgi:hypothetical protein
MIVRVAAALALIAALTLSFWAGWHMASVPRSCAYVHLQGASGVVCSNDFGRWVVQ